MERGFDQVVVDELEAKVVCIQVIVGRYLSKFRRNSSSAVTIHCLVLHTPTAIFLF